jgi:hypothetical protein
MTIWDDPSAEIVADFPARASSVRKIQANLTALAEGATGAPPVMPAAISADSQPAGATLVANSAGRFDAVPAGLATFDHMLGGNAVFHGWAIQDLDPDFAWAYAQQYYADTPGVIRITLGGDQCRGLAARPGNLSTQSWEINARVNVSGFSGGEGRHMFGFMRIAGDLNDGRPGGIYLMARQDTNSGNWFVYRRIPGGTTGNMDLSTIAVSGWQVLTCRRDADAETLEFLIDGVSVASYDTTTLELPPWTTGYDPAVALGRDGSGGTARLDIDWISFQVL